MYFARATIDVFQIRVMVVGAFPRVQKYIERMKNYPSAIKANVFSYKG
jgi:hypothetical protein